MRNGTKALCCALTFLEQRQHGAQVDEEGGLTWGQRSVDARQLVLQVLQVATRPCTELQLARWALLVVVVPGRTSAEAALIQLKMCKVKGAAPTSTAMLPNVGTLRFESDCSSSHCLLGLGQKLR